MKRVLTVFLSLLLLVTLLPPAVLAGTRFEDVKERDWYYDAVEYVCTRGLFHGISKTAFSPNGEMTRAMFVRVLANNTNGYDPADYTTASFDDVPAGKWYTQVVEWAYQNEIVAGTGHRTFEPERAITREEMAVILYNYINLMDRPIEVEMAGAPEPAAAFVDWDSVSHWALEAVQYAVSARLIRGLPGQRIGPRETATRAQAAQVFLNGHPKFAEPERIVNTTCNYVGTGDDEEMALCYTRKGSQVTFTVREDKSTPYGTVWIVHWEIWEDETAVHYWGMRKWELDDNWKHPYPGSYGGSFYFGEDGTVRWENGADNSTVLFQPE